MQFALSALQYANMISLRTCMGLVCCCLQEQVGEYGVHWNFFATIACVTLANQLVGRGLSSWRLGALAAATTLTHQAALTWGEQLHVGGQGGRDLCT